MTEVMDESLAQHAGVSKIVERYEVLDGDKTNEELFELSQKLEDCVELRRIVIEDNQDDDELIEEAKIEIFKTTFETMKFIGSQMLYSIPGLFKQMQQSGKLKRKEVTEADAFEKAFSILEQKIEEYEGGDEFALGRIWADTEQEVSLWLSHNKADKPYKVDPLVRNSNQLTHEEKDDLIRRAKQGDVEARNQVIENDVLYYMWYLRHKNFLIHKDFHSMESEDALQEIAIKAIEDIDNPDKYDPDKMKKANFTTYLTRFLNSRLRRLIYREYVPISIPAQYAQASGYDYMHFFDLSASSQRGSELEKLPHYEEYLLARPDSIDRLEAGVITDSDRFLTDPSYADPLDEYAQDISWQELLSDENRIEYRGDLFPSAELTSMPEEFGDYVVDSNYVERLLEHLDDRLAHIIKERFGMLDGEPKTLDNLGDQMGLTRERVRQLELKAMAILRTADMHMRRNPDHYGDMTRRRLALEALRVKTLEEHEKSGVIEGYGKYNLAGDLLLIGAHITSEQSVIFDRDKVEDLLTFVEKYGIHRLRTLVNNYTIRLGRPLRNWSTTVVEDYDVHKIPTKLINENIDLVEKFTEISRKQGMSMVDAVQTIRAYKYLARSNKKFFRAGGSVFSSDAKFWPDYVAQMNELGIDH